jgi:hypothetical protein
LPLDPLQALSGYDGSPQVAGAAGLLPAVLLFVHAMRTEAGTTFKPAPRNMTFGHESGLRGSNQTGASFKMRKLGSLPRLCWPLAGLSVGLNDLGAGSLGQVGQLIGELALRVLQSNEIGPSLSDVPRDAQKE